MKEGKLSSALMKRYGISEKNAIGKVLWHSLNEQSEIGVYDMKFGTTIVRNILAEDVKPILIKEHKHLKRDDDDPERLQEEDKDWIQKAVDPAHKGYCTPMTKKTCTPRRKALAMRFKKAGRKEKASHGKKTGWEGKV